MSNAKIMQHNNELPAHCGSLVPKIQFLLAGRQSPEKSSGEAPPQAVARNSMCMGSLQMRKLRTSCRDSRIAL